MNIEFIKYLLHSTFCLLTAIVCDKIKLSEGTIREDLIGKKIKTALEEEETRKRGVQAVLKCGPRYVFDDRTKRRSTECLPNGQWSHGTPMCKCRF